MLKQFLFIGIGGGIGSVLRYMIQLAISKHTSMVFPAGTFVVNITGCFLIGLFYALAMKENMLNFEWRLFLISGLCGGYTTFSSFSYENITLLKNGHYLQFSLYTGLSIFAGLICTVAGMAAGK
jgi:CrcB protein